MKIKYLYAVLLFINVILFSTPVFAENDKQWETVFKASDITPSEEASVYPNLFTDIVYVNDTILVAGNMQHIWGKHIEVDLAAPIYSDIIDNSSHIAISPDGKYLYTIGFIDNKDTILIINLETDEITKTLPSDYGLENIIFFDIKVGSNGELYVVNLENFTIVIFYPDMTSESLILPGEKSYFPQAIGISDSGQIIVAQNTFEGTRILIRSSEKEWFFLGSETSFDYISDICITDDGEVFITEPYKNKIYYYNYSIADEWIVWGSEGKESGQLKEPMGLNYKDGYLYVAETIGERVQRIRVKAEIISFDLPEINIISSNIDHDGKSIEIVVPADTDITSLSPAIKLYPGQIVIPASESIQDFTSPIEYTVYGYNDKSHKYIVNITKELSNENEIININIGGIESDAQTEIDHKNGIITVILPSDSDINNISVELELPSGAATTPSINLIEDWNKEANIIVEAANGDIKKYIINITTEDKQPAETISDKENDSETINTIEIDNENIPYIISFDIVNKVLVTEINDIYDTVAVYVKNSKEAEDLMIKVKTSDGTTTEGIPNDTYDLNNGLSFRVVNIDGTAREYNVVAVISVNSSVDVSLLIILGLSIISTAAIITVVILLLKRKKQEDNNNV